MRSIFEPRDPPSISDQMLGAIQKAELGYVIRLKDCTFDRSLVDTVSFTSCDECLRSTNDLDLIVYHAHQALLHDYNDADKEGPIKDLLGIAPVIILSAVDNPYEILKALESGARGYIADSDH